MNNVKYFCRTIGENIKRKRISMGITIKELSKTAGYNEMTLYLIEEGKKYPRIQTLVDIADSLNCDLFDFFNKLSRKK